MSHYRPYPAYKDSGVEWLGTLPNDWQVKPLWSVSTINDDERAEFSDDFEEIEYVDISTVTLEGGIASPSLLFAKDAPSRAQRKAKVGDVVISTVRTYLRAIGKVLPSHESAIFSTGFAIVRSAHGIKPEFLYYSLLSEYFLSEIEAQSTGVSYPAINASDLVKIKVPLPTMEEQQSISISLDRETTRIDALVSKKTRFIELLREKRRALITHAVTKGLDPNVKMKDSGVEWLGDLPEHWEVIPLRYLIEYIESGTSVNATDIPASDGEIGVLKTSCVYSGVFDPSENKAVVPEEYDRVSCPVQLGTLIVSRMNTPDLVGAAGLVIHSPKGIYLPDRLWQISFSKILSAFAYYWSQSVSYRAQVKMVCTGTSSSMQNLSQDQFRDFIFAKPSTEEQAAIVARLDQETIRIDTLITKTERSIELLKERRSALITAAVTGQIDLREAV